MFIISEIDSGFDSAFFFSNQSQGNYWSAHGCWNATCMLVIAPHSGCCISCHDCNSPFLLSFWHLAFKAPNVSFKMAISDVCTVCLRSKWQSCWHRPHSESCALRNIALGRKASEERILEQHITVLASLPGSRHQEWTFGHILLLSVLASLGRVQGQEARNEWFLVLILVNQAVSLSLESGLCYRAHMCRVYMSSVGRIATHLDAFLASGRAGENISGKILPWTHGLQVINFDHVTEYHVIEYHVTE